MKRNVVTSFVSTVGLIAVLTAGASAAAAKPKDAEYAISRAEALRKEKKWDESAAMLKKALAMSPSGYNRWAYMGLGEIYFERGMFGRSREYFSFVKLKEPEFLLPYLYIGQMQYLTAKSAKSKEERIAAYKAAQDNFNEVARRGSGNIGAEGHIGKALVSMKLGLRDDAQKSANNAKADDPKIQAALKAAFSDNRSGGHRYRQAYYDDACKLFENLKKPAQSQKPKPIASITRIPSPASPAAKHHGAAPVDAPKLQASAEPVSEMPDKPQVPENMTVALPAGSNPQSTVAVPPTQIGMDPALSAAVASQAATDSAQTDMPFTSLTDKQKTDYIVKRYQAEKKRMAVSIELLPAAGTLTTNGFGYPTKFLGYTIAFGYTTRTYKNIPDSADVKYAAADMLAKNPDLDYDELADRIRLELHPGYFDFLEIGTEALVLPKISFGQAIPLKRTLDNRSYFEWKVGFPVPFSIGFALEF